MILVAAAMVGLFFILVLYQQQVEGYSALKSGLSQLPLGVVLVVVAGLAGPLAERVGSKRVLIAGTTILAAGIAWLSRIPVHGSYLTDILGPSLVIGVGLGLSFVSLMVASASGIGSDDAGLAGGLINATQQIGGAIGLAIVTAIATGHAHSAVHDLTQLDGGFRAALVVAAGIAAAATLAAAVLLPGRSRGLAVRPFQAELA
jgi:MFS family permease